jgi:hypothetical protein
MKEGVVAGGTAEIEDAFGLEIVAGEGVAGVLGGETGLGFVEAGVGVFEEDETEDGSGVFGGAEAGIGAEGIGHLPEAGFDVFEFGCHWG